MRSTPQDPAHTTADPSSFAGSDQLKAEFAGVLVASIERGSQLTVNLVRGCCVAEMWCQGFTEFRQTARNGCRLDWQVCTQRLLGNHTCTCDVSHADQDTRQRQLTEASTSGTFLGSHGDDALGRDERTVEIAKTS